MEPGRGEFENDGQIAEARARQRPGRTRLSTPIQFYFFIGSPYTYLAVERIESVSRIYGRELAWRPVSRRILAGQNPAPSRENPVKAAYLRRDVERRARRHRIPFTSFPPCPVDPQELATRLALIGSRAGWCPPFVKAVYRDWFIGGIPPGDPLHLGGILHRMGLDARALLAEADSRALRQRYADETDAAEAMGIFGVPSFISEDEVFWGDDRMEEAMEWTTR